MDPLWLLKGERTAPGWRELEQDSKADAVELVIFDRAAWALVRAASPPTKYQGLDPIEPVDGIYVSEQGWPIYVVDRQEVGSVHDVVEALGQEAAKLLEQLGDPVRVLERLGRAF